VSVVCAPEIELYFAWEEQTYDCPVSVATWTTTETILMNKPTTVATIQFAEDDVAVTLVSGKATAE